MRVLHVTRDFPPRHAGGISTAVGGVVRASLRAGIEAAVISFDGWRPATRADSPAAVQPEAGGGVEVVRVCSRAQVDAAGAWAAALRPALLHVHHGTLWEFAERLREVLGVPPAVQSVHVAQKRLNRLRGTCERTLSLIGQEAALARADRIVAPSRAAAAVIEEDHPEVAARLRIAPLGIDAGPHAASSGNSIPPPPPEPLPLPSPELPDISGGKETQRHGLELGQANFWTCPPQSAHRGGGRVLYVGRFADVKGISELFDIARLVLASVPDASFTIAGGVPGNRRAEARWRRRWDREAPAAARARTRFTGWLRAEKLARHYAEASVLVVPSRFETFGLAALEGMRYGVAVAATDTPALTELIRHGETGLLSPVADAPAMAAHVVSLLRDPARARALGHAAAAEVRRHRLWDHVLPDLRRVYDEIA
jgi:glycogen(starch) synthase